MVDHIEMFCNPKRKHVRKALLSPVEFERRQENYPEGVHKKSGLFRPVALSNRGCGA